MSQLLDIEKSAQRDIKSGLQYENLFPPANLLDKVVFRDGGVNDTVKTMQEIVHKYLADTRLIAPKLKGKTLEETCRNIWNFLYWHCQYKLDEAGLEQLRRPARAWHDRYKGIDCDCFSIFASSILTNLDIPHAFRITKYKKPDGSVGDWQHVYVIVPKPNGGNYTIDCVAHHNNYEKPFHNKIDHTMTQLNGIPIAVLSGADDSHDDELYGILSGADFEEVERLEGLGQIPSEELALGSIYNHLVRTRNYIEKNPQSVFTTGGAEPHLQMLGYAITNWHTPNRDNALDLLEEEEERWNQVNGIEGFEGDEDEINGLGAPKAKKKFFKKVKEAVKKVGKKVGTVAKKIGKTLVRFNPLALAVRGGFLLAMKINLLQMAEKIYPAYLTEAEAKAKGVPADKWQKAKTALARIEKLFVDKLQGKSDKLKSAITKGRASKQFKGFGELGEPATIATVVASAVPLITAYNEIKKAGLKGLSEDAAPPEATKQGFITLIKEWWKKTFGKENATAPESVSEDEKQPNESAGDSTTEEEGEEETSRELEKSDGKKISVKKSGDGPEEGGWSKFKAFAKENPGKVAVGGVAAAAVVTGVVLGINHAIKKSKEKKASTSVGLAGNRNKGRRRSRSKPKPIILK